MENRFLCGILIGLLFGMPAGAVGAMTVQRTLNYGMKSGLLTGLGSSAADCLYACVGAFGLTVISDFLLTCQNIIHIFGGCLILFMGIRLLVKKTESSNRDSGATGGLTLFLSFFCSRNYQSGGCFNISVRFFLVWLIGTYGNVGWYSACMRCVCRNLSLVGRSFCGSDPVKEKSRTRRLWKGKPYIRGNPRRL